MGELRQSDRYLPKRGAYIVFSPSFTRRGPLINISRHGLSCIYYVNDTMDARSLDTCVNIRYGNFFLGGLPFRIISDKRIGTGRFGPFKMVRQRSLIFEGLSVSQVVQVDYFIQNFTRLKYGMMEGVPLPGKTPR